MKQSELEELQAMLEELHRVSARLHDIAGVVCEQKEIVDTIVENTNRIHNRAQEAGLVMDQNDLDRLSSDYDAVKSKKLTSPRRRKSDYG